MKKIFVSFLYVLFTLILYSQIGCKQSPVEPSTDYNLLSNGSFELNNTPTLEGWRFGNQQLTKLSSDVPPNGGNWSLQLTSDWAPTTGFVYAPITNIKSGNIIRLSAFVRATGKFGGRGIITLSVGPKVYNGHMKSSSSSDTVWNQISVTDTLTLSSSDTLWVILSAPVTEIIPFRQLFDLVKLEKVAN